MSSIRPGRSLPSQRAQWVMVCGVMFAVFGGTALMIINDGWGFECRMYLVDVSCMEAGVVLLGVGMLAGAGIGWYYSGFGLSSKGRGPRSKGRPKGQRAKSVSGGA